MKYLSVIWGMVIFLLACLPCTDSGTAYAQCETTTVQATHSHADPAQGADLCSPLCECNCCGGITLSFSCPQLAEPPHNPQGSYLSAYLPGGAVSPSFPFWHPPKA